MLKITKTQTEEYVAIKLEGRVAGPWVDELARTWADTAPHLGAKRLSLDIRDVTYADFKGTNALRTIYGETHAELIANTPWTKYLVEEIKSIKEDPVDRQVDEYKRRFRSLLQLPGKFFNKLSEETFNTLMWMACPMSCAPGDILFEEDELQMESVYLILDGKVKLSISAPDSDVVTYNVAKKGDILGLASVLSGTASEMRAEILDSSKIARIWRQDFLNFLSNYPDAYDAVLEEVREDLLSAMYFLRAVKRAQPTDTESGNGELQYRSGAAFESTAAINDEAVR
jgi:CRP-like cAMP-binding protein